MLRYLKILCLITLFSPLAMGFEKEDLDSVFPAPFANPLAWNGVIATSTFTPFDLDEAAYRAHETIFHLKDGTVLSGYFFKSFRREQAPLLIMSLGFDMDKTAIPSRFYITKILSKHLVNAHVLFMDHVTSAEFYKHNQMLSIGGYDEARMLIETAQIFKNHRMSAFSKAPTEISASRFSQVHLMGGSMGGAAVVYALHEQERLHKNWFASSMTMSMTVDYAKVPGHYLTTFGGENNPWRKDPEMESGFFFNILQRFTLSLLMQHFEKVVEEHDLENPGFEIPKKEYGKFFYDNFSKRIDFLRAQKLKDWDPSISLASLEDYMRTTQPTRVAAQIHTPLLLLFAKDDPIVPRDHFEKMHQASSSNPLFYSKLTGDGGHLGFGVAYGEDWLAEVFNVIVSANE